MLRLVHWLRAKLQASNFLTYTFIIFLSGFFFFPDDHLHRNFFYLFVLLPFLFELDLSAFKRCFKSKIFVISLVFLIYFGLSIIWTKNVEVSLENYYDTIRYFLMLIAFMVMTVYLFYKNENFFYQTILWTSLFVSISAIISIIIFYGSHVFPVDRVTGFNYYLKYTIITATYFAFIAICTLYLSIHEKMIWRKIYFSIITCIILMFVLFTQSRGPLLAFIVAILIGLTLDKRWKLICFVFLIPIVWLFVINFADIGIQNYIFRGSIPFRFAIWKSTLMRILENPWLGEGYLTNIEIYALNRWWCHPHNIFLIVLLKSGVLGLLLFFILLVMSVKAALRYFITSRHWIYISLILFAIIISSSDNMRLLYKPVMSWMVFWFPLALLSATEVKLNEKNSSREEDLI